MTHHMDERNSPALDDLLRQHHMATDTPSQLSYAFRLGYWAAQAEIARLQAEVERLTDFIRHIGKVNGKMHADMTAVARSEIDNAHNAAIEKAAALFTHPDEEGIADRIRDLKR